MTRFVFRLSLLMLIALTIPFVAAEDRKESDRDKQSEFKMSREEKTLLELLNKERVKHELPALEPHPLLFKAARSHAANMAKQRKMEHILDGKTVGQRVDAAGYNWAKVSENLAIAEDGEPPLSAIVKQWMESKLHRENLLGKDVAETGVAIARNDKGEIYYIQVLARPRKVRKP